VIIKLGFIGGDSEAKLKVDRNEFSFGFWLETGNALGLEQGWLRVDELFFGDCLQKTS
jgi:hypothetical protein